jgi:protein-disulfide isomerase
VFRELPILSQESEAAARLALTAARSGRYMDVHRALFASGNPNAAARSAVGQRFMIAVDAATLNNPAITGELRANVALARELGFDGTPSWVIGDKVLTGAVGYDALKAAIAAARG